MAEKIVEKVDDRLKRIQEELKHKLHNHPNDNRLKDELFRFNQLRQLIHPQRKIILEITYFGKEDRFNIEQLTKDLNYHGYGTEFKIKEIKEVLMIED